MSFSKAKNKYAVFVCINGKSKFFGYYKTVEQARNVAISQKNKMHGEFSTYHENFK